MRAEKPIPFSMTFPIRSPRCRGFTLVELLVVSVILGVLFMLALAATGKVRQTAARSACQSNLRNLGAAILLYAADHDQYLPYNANVAVSGFYQRNDSGGLGANLAPYLGLPLPSMLPAKPAKQNVDILTCPARRNDPSSSPSYIVKCNLLEVPRQRPFGASEYGSSDAARPMSLLALGNLPNQGGLSKIWAVMDMDQEVTYSQAAKSAWAKDLPKEPIHGHTRNVLFFDGHVESLAKLP